MTENTDKAGLRPESVLLDVDFYLMRDIQSSLYTIARIAESYDEPDIVQIQKEADIVLRLLDGYILTNNYCSGQLQMSFEPVGAGSLVHEVAYDIKKFMGTDVEVKIKNAEPLSSNKNLLRHLLFALGVFMSRSGRSSLKFLVYKGDDSHTSLAITAKDFEIKNSQINNIVSKSGELAYMSFAQHTNQSGLIMMTAKLMAKTLNSKLEVRKIDGQKGFYFSLPKSQQMSLI